MSELQRKLRELDILSLQSESFRKKAEYIVDNFPEDETISAWCADLTEDLSGDVGTLEIPGERGTVLIQPGYEDNAVYNLSRDGQIQPLIAANPYQTYYNLAMFPGWQKWKPTFRFGTITSIDSENDKANVTLDSVSSSQQALNINQSNTLTDVPVEYMSCNSAAFEVDDEVIIKFEYDWSTPKVIGFKDNPKACEEFLYISATGDITRCIVWDMQTNAYATDIPLNGGGFASFPVDPSTISDWINSKSDIGTTLFTQPLPSIGVKEGDLPYYLCSIPSEGGTCNNSSSLAISGYDENGDAIDDATASYTLTGTEDYPIYEATSESIVNIPCVSRIANQDGWVWLSKRIIGGNNTSYDVSFRVKRYKDTDDYYYVEEYGAGDYLYTTAITKDYNFYGPNGYLNSFSITGSNYAERTDPNDPTGNRTERVIQSSIAIIDGKYTEKIITHFLVHELIVKTTQWDTCGQIPGGGWTCDPFPVPDPTITYSNTIPYSVSAYSADRSDENDADDINPFSLSKNTNLSNSMGSLANLVAATPADGECLDVDFGIQILR